MSENSQQEHHSMSYGDGNESNIHTPHDYQKLAKLKKNRKRRKRRNSSRKKSNHFTKLRQQRHHQTANNPREKSRNRRNQHRPRGQNSLRMDQEPTKYTAWKFSRVRRVLEAQREQQILEAVKHKFDYSEPTILTRERYSEILTQAQGYGGSIPFVYLPKRSKSKNSKNDSKMRSKGSKDIVRERSVEDSLPSINKGSVYDRKLPYLKKSKNESRRDSGVIEPVKATANKKIDLSSIKKGQSRYMFRSKKVKFEQLKNKKISRFKGAQNSESSSSTRNKADSSQQNQNLERKGSKDKNKRVNYFSKFRSRSVDLLDPEAQGHQKPQDNAQNQQQTLKVPNNREQIFEVVLKNGTKVMMNKAEYLAFNLALSQITPRMPKRSPRVRKESQQMESSKLGNSGVSLSVRTKKNYSSTPRQSNRESGRRKSKVPPKRLKE